MRQKAPNLGQGFENKPQQARILRGQWRHLPNVLGFFLLVLWGLAGCQTTQQAKRGPLTGLPPKATSLPRPDSPPNPPETALPSAPLETFRFADQPGPSDAAVDGLRLQVVALAAKYVGKTSMPCRGRRLQRDCSGFIRCIFSHVGLDLMRVPTKRNDNGVLLIQRYSGLHGTLHKAKAPAIGDLVFWHYTYDRDQNNRLDDRWTHIGIVEGVEPDGRIALLHYSEKVKRIYMHLSYPFSSRTLLGYQAKIPDVPRCHRADKRFQRCLHHVPPKRCFLWASRVRELCRLRREPVYRVMNSLLIRHDDPRKLHGSTTGELFAGFGTVLQTSPSHRRLHDRNSLVSWSAPLHP